MNNMNNIIFCWKYDNDKQLLLLLLIIQPNVQYCLCLSAGCRRGCESYSKEQQATKIAQNIRVLLDEHTTKEAVAVNCQKVDMLM